LPAEPRSATCCPVVRPSWRKGYVAARGCDAVLNAWCATEAGCELPQHSSCTDGTSLPLVARLSSTLHSQREDWRCFSASALSDDGQHYSGYISPDAYCTRDAPLRSLLATCLAQPPALPPPPPSPPPPPRPPLPPPAPPPPPPAPPPPVPCFIAASQAAGRLNAFALGKTCPSFRVKNDCARRSGPHARASYIDPPPHGQLRPALLLTLDAAPGGPRAVPRTQPPDSETSPSTREQQQQTAACPVPFPPPREAGEQHYYLVYAGGGDGVDQALSRTA
jgi:hypothetical protein